MGADPDGGYFGGASSAGVHRDQGRRYCEGLEEVKEAVGEQEPQGM